MEGRGWGGLEGVYVIHGRLRDCRSDWVPKLGDNREEERWWKWFMVREGLK